MCKFFKLSRAPYYKWLKRTTVPDPDQDRMALVQEAWLKSRRTYGYRRVTIALQKQGQVINHTALLPENAKRTKK